MDANIKTTIENHIRNNKVALFTKGTKEQPRCGFSSQVVQIFTTLDVPFATLDVLASEALRQGIKEFSNWPTVPQVYINGEFVGGCDIVTEMYQKGELQPLLKDAAAS